MSGQKGERDMKQTVVTSGGDAAVELDKIPAYEMDHLARATLHAVERYFALPGVKEKYEEWLVEYKKRTAIT